jgi:hypothetical protein
LAVPHAEFPQRWHSSAQPSQAQPWQAGRL